MRSPARRGDGGAIANHSIAIGRRSVAVGGPTTIRVAMVCEVVDGRA